MASQGQRPEDPTISGVHEGGPAKAAGAKPVEAKQEPATSQQTPRPPPASPNIRGRTTEEPPTPTPAVPAVHPRSANSEQAGEAPAAKRPILATLLVTLIIAGIVWLSISYLSQPQPLLVQGEADATRIDISARVDGRVDTRPVERGDNIAAGQVLLTISNPELITKLNEAEAAKAVADADLKRILVGTRKETVAERLAAVASAAANLKLSQQTYDRTRQLSEKGYAATQKLDEAKASLDVSQRSWEQAQLSYKAAVAGYTLEERGVAKASLAKAEAAIVTLRAQIDELTVKAPIRSQVYQISAELGEYVSPGVPLLSLVDLSEVYMRFDLREDLVRALKVGQRYQVKVPALRDRVVTIAVRTIATRGEYAGWRATRATGDFDLRTFEVRAYPVEPIAELRPGMSAYLDVNGVR